MAGWRGRGAKGAAPMNATDDIRLCEEQRDVIDALRRPLEMIQGPPGTGKTRVLVAHIAHLVRAA